MCIHASSIFVIFATTHHYWHPYSSSSQGRSSDSKVAKSIFTRHLQIVAKIISTSRHLQKVADCKKQNTKDGQVAHTCCFLNFKLFYFKFSLQKQIHKYKYKITNTNTYLLNYKVSSQLPPTKYKYTNTNTNKTALEIIPRIISQMHSNTFCHLLHRHAWRRDGRLGASNCFVKLRKKCWSIQTIRQIQFFLQNMGNFPTKRLLIKALSTSSKVIFLL